jgi:hypothetical protein
VLAQPYQSAIDEYGETGLVYLGGQFSHGFRKAPIFADNDQNHNGLYVVEEITLRIPSAAERAFGDKVVQFVKDKFGVSWQVTSPQMGQYLGGSDSEGAKRATQAMLEMRKIDLETMRKAYEGI